MKLSVLIENDVCSLNSKQLKSEHGISLYIEINDKKLLFDVGKSDLFYKNAQKMGIDISEVDFLVISHGHYDHTGGLQKFLEINHKAKVYIHKKAVNPYYAKLLGFIPIYIGMNTKLVSRYTDRFIFIDKDESIAEDLLILENFTHDFPLPSGNASLFKKQNNRYIQDDFQHEILLVLKEENKNVVITACSHSGVINMYNKAKKSLNEAKIDAVFGGFHTYNPAKRKSESKDYLNRLVEEIKKTDAVFYTGHCTGIKNYDYLKRKLKNQLQTMHTGEVIEI